MLLPALLSREWWDMIGSNSKKLLFPNVFCTVSCSDCDRRRYLPFHEPVWIACLEYKKKGVMLQRMKSYVPSCPRKK